MAFFNKLKNFAGLAANKITTMQQEREKNAQLQSLECFGDITGDLPPNARYYYIDNEKNRFILSAEYNNKYVCEYKCSEFTDFRLLDYTIKSLPDIQGHHYTFQITLASGEKMSFNELLFIHTEKDHNKKIMEQLDKSKIRKIILAFLYSIKDSATIKWVNEFYESDNLLPLFDDNGEISTNNIINNTSTLSTRYL